MTPETVQAEARIFVIEALLSLLLASHHQAHADPKAALEHMRRLLVDRARYTMVGDDPVISDLMSAELEAAIERAVDAQRAWLGLQIETARPDE